MFVYYMRCSTSVQDFSSTEVIDTCHFQSHKFDFLITYGEHQFIVKNLRFGPVVSITMGVSFARRGRPRRENSELLATSRVTFLQNMCLHTAATNM